MVRQMDRRADREPDNDAPEPNPELCLLGQAPRALANGDFAIRTLSPHSVAVEGGYFGRGIRKEQEDGSLTAYSATGIAIMRDQDNRIINATTSAGHQVEFHYKNGVEQPTSFTYMNITYNHERGPISLDQQTGEFTCVRRNGTVVVHNLHGESREFETNGNVTTTTRNSGVESTTTNDQNGNLLFYSDLQNGVWTTVETIRDTLPDGRVQHEQLPSMHNPQGREMEVPGLTREQVNCLRAERGMNPLRADEPAVWRDNITTVVSVPGTDLNQNPVRFQRYTSRDGRSYDVTYVAGMAGGGRFWMPGSARSPLDIPEDGAVEAGFIAVPGRGIFPGGRRLPNLPDLELLIEKLN